MFQSSEPSETYRRCIGQGDFVDFKIFMGFPVKLVGSHMKYEPVSRCEGNADRKPSNEDESGPSHRDGHRSETPEESQPPASTRQRDAIDLEYYISNGTSKCTYVAKPALEGRAHTFKRPEYFESENEADQSGEESYFTMPGKGRSGAKRKEYLARRSHCEAYQSVAPKVADDSRSSDDVSYPARSEEKELRRSKKCSYIPKPILTDGAHSKESKRAERRKAVAEKSREENHSSPSGKFCLDVKENRHESRRHPHCEEDQGVTPNATDNSRSSDDDVYYPAWIRPRGETELRRLKKCSYIAKPVLRGRANKSKRMKAEDEKSGEENDFSSSGTLCLEVEGNRYKSRRKSHCEGDQAVAPKATADYSSSSDDVAYSAWTRRRDRTELRRPPVYAYIAKPVLEGNARKHEESNREKVSKKSKGDKGEQGEKEFEKSDENKLEKRQEKSEKPNDDKWGNKSKKSTEDKWDMGEDKRSEGKKDSSKPGKGCLGVRGMGYRARKAHRRRRERIKHDKLIKSGKMKPKSKFMKKLSKLFCSKKTQNDKQTEKESRGLLRVRGKGYRERKSKRSKSSSAGASESSVSRGSIVSERSISDENDEKDLRVKNEGGVKEEPNTDRGDSDKKKKGTFWFRKNKSKENDKSTNARKMEDPIKDEDELALQVPDKGSQPKDDKASTWSQKGKDLEKKGKEEAPNREKIKGSFLLADKEDQPKDDETDTYSNQLVSETKGRDKKKKGKGKEETPTKEKVKGSFRVADKEDQPEDDEIATSSNQHDSDKKDKDKVKGKRKGKEETPTKVKVKGSFRMADKEDQPEDDEIATSSNQHNSDKKDKDKDKGKRKGKEKTPTKEKVKGSFRLAAEEDQLEFDEAVISSNQLQDLDKGKEKKKGKRKEEPPTRVKVKGLIRVADGEDQPEDVEADTSSNQLDSDKKSKDKATGKRKGKEKAPTRGTDEEEAEGDEAGKSSHGLTDSENKGLAKKKKTDTDKIAPSHSEKRSKVVGKQEAIGPDSDSTKTNKNVGKKQKNKTTTTRENKGANKDKMATDNVLLKDSLTKEPGDDDQERIVESDGDLDDTTKGAKRKDQKSQGDKLPPKKKPVKKIDKTISSPPRKTPKVIEPEVEETTRSDSSQPVSRANKPGSKALGKSRSRDSKDDEKKPLIKANTRVVPQESPGDGKRRVPKTVPDDTHRVPKPVPSGKRRVSKAAPDGKRRMPKAASEGKRKVPKAAAPPSQSLLKTCCCYLCVTFNCCTCCFK